MRPEAWCWRPAPLACSMGRSRRAPIRTGRRLRPRIAEAPRGGSPIASRGHPPWALFYYARTMSGRPFLQIPGPTNVPERVLRAMDRAVIDHRSPEFAELTQAVRSGLRAVFGTREGVPMLYPASGTGATEAALVNLLAPGDRVLVFSYGHFSSGLAVIARKFGFEVDEVPLRWGQALPADQLEAK